MVTGANCHALPVQDGSGVVWMHTVDYEGKYAGLFPRRADQAQSGSIFERSGSVLKKVVLVRLGGFHADLVQVVDRGAEPYDARNIRRAGFELVRQLVVS